MMITTALLLVTLAGKNNNDLPAEKPIKPLPTLSKEPKLDGVLKDFQGAELKVAKEAAGVVVKAGFKKDTLYLAISTKDDKVVMGDAVAVNLFFPTAGTTARGVRYLFGPDGKRKDDDAPAWAQELVKAGAKADPKGLTLEIAIPARALPRMPAQLQLALNICVDVMNKGEGEGDPVVSTTCTNGEMVGGPTRLPDELRKNLKLSPPLEVEGLEARANGWVGYAVLHYPIWLISDAKLTPETLTDLIAGDKAIDPKSVQLPLPPSMELADGRPIFTVLTGQNPYIGDTCKGDNELRMALYVAKGNAATRVLEWPAATCSLGRAMSFDLNNDGGLTIGYTNGSTAHFSWSSDHFERSELGKK